MEGKPSFKDVFGDSHTLEDFVREIRKFGRWAFVRIVRGEATIHWYAQDRISDRLVAHMLGHEMGHITGVRKKRPVAEEVRADAYGDVAMEITEMLQLRHARRRPAPKARRRGKASARTSRRASSRKGR